MAQNQILATLQIESNEVRLIVGEFFNTRLNVLKTECVACRGMDGIRIVDQNEVARAIRKAVDNASSYLGVPITTVLLAIPAYRFKKETRSFSKMIEAGDRKITYQDIRDIYSKAWQVNVGTDLVIVNIASNSFRINGIVYRKLPVGEQCDVLEVDVDLLCCDKLTTYDYAQVVELSGLKIIDIYLDNYSACKEAALFEQAMRSYLLAIQLEKQHTLFSLIYDGKIISSENENIGYESLAKAISKKYSLPDKHSFKLLTKYVNLAQKDFNDRPVNSWTMNQVTSSVTDRDLYEAVQDAVEYMANDFRTLCEPILMQENVQVVLLGSGAEIEGAGQILSSKFGKPVKCYYPDTLGVRGCRWTVGLGMFYAYIDQQGIHQDGQSSIDIEAFQQKVNAAVQDNEHEEGLTARLKNILFTSQRNS